MTIANAVSDLQETIAEEGLDESLISDIAEDWEVKPALLARKFEEKYGKSPSEYQAVSARQAREQALARARSKAEANPEYCGKHATTTINHIEIVVIELYQDAIAGVKIDTGETIVWKINKPACIRLAHELGV